MKKVLIVNYGFPPNPGIGGRRWALFAKELSKKGFQVHVLTKKNDTKEVSLYSNVLTDENIILHTLPTFYPNILNTIPKTIKDKIQYKVWNTLMSIYSKGSQFDKALFFEKKIKKIALKIIQENEIKDVLVSGAPFRLCYYFAKMKSIIPNLMIDFRDPWTWGTGYGYNSLSKKKFDFEKKMEAFVLEKSDIIFCPVEIMKAKLEALYPSFKHKIKVLPHGFDKEGIKQHDGNRFKNNKAIKLIFIGTLYDGIEPYLKEIAKALSKKEVLYSLDIYSNSERYKEIFCLSDKTKQKVNYHKPLSPSELYHKIGEYDFCLIIHPKYGKDNISTKFYEVIYSKTPIIYVGEQGYTNKFISKNKVGITVLPDQISSFFLRNIKDEFNYSPVLDIQKFSYTRINERLMSYFN